jgi:hypothetical protein
MRSTGLAPDDDVDHQADPKTTDPPRGGVGRVRPPMTSAWLHIGAELRRRATTMRRRCRSVGGEASAVARLDSRPQRSRLGRQDLFSALVLASAFSGRVGSDASFHCRSSVTVDGHSPRRRTADPVPGCAATLRRRRAGSAFGAAARCRDRVWPHGFSRVAALRVRGRWTPGSVRRRRR